MKTFNFTIEYLASFGKLNPEDIKEINKCRKPYTSLGFGYQLAFVKLLNRFPTQQPFELADDILDYVCVQLGVSRTSMSSYIEQREIIIKHQNRIRKYLELRRFKESEVLLLNKFLFEECCQFEQSNVLLSKTQQFLREQKILKPSDDTLLRLIGTQKKLAKEFIFKKINSSITPKLKKNLDLLLKTNEKNLSQFHFIKLPAEKPSSVALLNLIKKIEIIKATGVLDIELSWLSNNFQRSFTRQAKQYDANKIKELEPQKRYAILVSFLIQFFKETTDLLFDMYDKLINRVYNKAQRDLDAHDKTKRKQIRESLSVLKIVGQIVLDETVEDSEIRSMVFQNIGRDEFSSQIDNVTIWLDGKYNHVFKLVRARFNYIRQFSPAFVKHIELEAEGTNISSILKGIETLREMNETHKRKLPEDVPVDFIPKKIRPFVETNGNIDKAAWECALLTAIRDEIKLGNLSLKESKQFSRFTDFFIPESKWELLRESFFKRAGLPSEPTQIKDYLKTRLNKAFEQFLKKLPGNTYVTVVEKEWQLSTDPAEKLTPELEKELRKLKRWLSKNLRTIKLPELLIEVDNELKITRHFMLPSQQKNPEVANICAILVTLIAHGCNIGPYTMSHLIKGISYEEIKQVTDWMFTEETQRSALATVVNAISRLDVTQAWGKGKTSSSDGQRFTLRHKVLQQTYSPKFNDFALEFYSFVADNFAPFYSFPVECTNRDAPYVLDGLLYNESELPLEEHYVDTHGYTENNFAAFALLGKKFSPRIKGLHKQRIYKIDKTMDYQALHSLVHKGGNTIHTDWIVEQWDKLGHFYSSLESGHATASTAMKRLNGFSEKNHFYRANRELGRIFKTEYILQYMSDKALRQRTRRGLLKGEQLHALARELSFGKRGQINNRELQEQKMSCSCLTLLMACIIYWQAKEINRVIFECEPEKNKIDLSLIEHISPISWGNVIFYGEYVLDRSLIRI